jgi:hypothetical protein
MDFDNEFYTESKDECTLTPKQTLKLIALINIRYFVLALLYTNKSAKDRIDEEE